MLYKVVLSFESVDEILQHISNETYQHIPVATGFNWKCEESCQISSLTSSGKRMKDTSCDMKKNILDEK